MKALGEMDPEGTAWTPRCILDDLNMTDNGNMGFSDDDKVGEAGIALSAGGAALEQ